MRLSERVFLVVIPGASTRHLAGVCDDIAAQLEFASRGYPDVSLAPGIATVVTPSRPLPIAELLRALDQGGTEGLGTGEGDRITVVPVATVDPPA